MKLWMRKIVRELEAKGDKDPSNWLPPAITDQCSYVGDVVKRPGIRRGSSR